MKGIVNQENTYVNPDYRMDYAGSVQVETSGFKKLKRLSPITTNGTCNTLGVQGIEATINLPKSVILNKYIKINFKLGSPNQNLFNIAISESFQLKP